MADRDLGFNIGANAAKALDTFASMSQAVDRLANRILLLGNTKATPTVTLDEAKIQQQIDRITAKLDALKAKKADPSVDANITLAENKITALTTKLDALRNKRVDPVIDPQIASAQAKLDEVTKELDALARKSPSPVVTLQTALATQKASVLTAELERLNALRVDPVVDLEISNLEAKIVLVQAKLDELRAKKADVKIDASIAEFEAKLALLMVELERVRAAGGNVRVGGANREAEVNSFSRAIAALTGGIFGAVTQSARLAQNFRGLAIISSISAGLPTVVSLADTLATAAQSALLIPGALAGIGAVAVTLGVAFSGLAKAFGPQDTPAQIKKVQAAMDKLSPSTQQFVKDVRSLLPAFRDLRAEVQSDLFAGIGAELKSLTATYLPLMKTGLGGIATALNGVAKDFGAFFQRAGTIADTKIMFDLFKTSVMNLSPGLINIASAFRNIAEVGATFLPGLSKTFTGLTNTFDVFIQKARDDGSLAKWTADGIVALDALGTLIKNVGKVLGDMFRASEAAGQSTISVLNEALSTLHQFFSSAQGQNGLINLFQGIHDVIQSIRPGVIALLDGIAQAIGIIRPTVVALGDAFSAIAKAVAPAIPMIAQVAADIGGPLLAGVTGLVNVFGGLLPLLITGAVAFKAFSLAGAAISSLGVGIGNTATKLGLLGTQAGLGAGGMNRMATAGSAVGTTLGKVGSALPIIGLAVVGLAMVWDTLKSHASDAADAVLKGTTSIQAAIADEAGQIAKQNDVFGTGIITTSAYGKAAGESAQRINNIATASQFAGQTTDGMTQAEINLKKATDNINRSLSEKLNAMTPLQAAQAQVTIDESRYQQALETTGSTSQTTKDAAGALQFAREGLKAKTDALNDAEKTAAERLIDSARAAQDAANADVNAEDASLRYATAVDNANEVLKKHTATSREGRQAIADVTRAALDDAAAMGTKAQADATARGEADAAQQGAVAYKNELLKLADSAKGPVRQALLDAAANVHTVSDAQNTAITLTGSQRDQLGQLAAQANGPLKQALLDAQKNFNDLAGAHANASDRAQAQKDKLIALASSASGPVRQALLDMANQVQNLPDGSFTVTATGSIGAITGFGAVGGAALTRAAHGGGFTGGLIDVDHVGLRGVEHSFASGGVMPGYTPGRDVHTFRSPTAGTLNLSGGEAIMRPEWTAAVGPTFVHEANRAASSGGVYGATKFMKTRHFAEGGIFDDGPTQSFAGGGIVMAGTQPFTSVSSGEYVKVAQAMIDQMRPMVYQMIQAAQAAAAAAAAAVSGVATGHAENVAAVQAVAASYGWSTGTQWADLVAVINRESGFNNTAQNPHSTAYGMFQFLDSTWGAYGATKTSDAHAQAVAGLRYIAQRYGSPAGALAHEQQYGWYDEGGIANGMGFMQKMTTQPERVLSPDQTKQFERLVHWLTTSRSSTAVAGATAVPQLGLAELKGEIQALGVTLTNVVKQARPITVEDKSGNPNETGRAVSLALRL